MMGAVIADVPRVKLLELVGRFGPGLSRDARQCKALLADVCNNQYRAECAVLVAAAEEGVAGELLGSSSGLPTEVLLGRLSDRLHANRGVADELARWSVESWAVALGVAGGGSTLAKFKMDGLLPLIDLAGADGTITDAELDHLIAEAKTRGVSEADARAYLSAHAATRGWQVGRSQRRRQRSAAPSSPQQVSLQPVQPAPTPQPKADHTFHYVLAGVAALVAIAVILAILRLSPQPQPQASAPPPKTVPAPTPAPTPTPSTSPDQADREQRAYNAARGNAAALRDYVNSCSVCAYAAAARSEIAKLDNADQEQRTYNAARGNTAALRAYLNSCSTCVYASDARNEITRLEAADQEERAYNGARGNKYALRAYINTCSVCAYAPSARNEIGTLEASEPKRVSSSTVICGRQVGYVIDAAGATDPYRSFLGLWTGAAWSSRICGGLIVESVDSTGAARVTYIYGPLPGAQFGWKQQSPAALIRYGQLTFTDEEGGNFTFRLDQPDTLRGHFVSVRGVTLNAVLSRDMSSVPR